MNDKTIKILFAGDFCSKSPEEIILSKEMKSLFDECDIKCINFEGPLATGDPIIIKGTALLPQSDLSPKWCEDNGFNIISLANNHAFDYGEQGLIKTRQAFKKSLTVGAGIWDETYQVKILDFQGTKIGFFSATQADFAALKDKWTDTNIEGCPWINHSEVNKKITQAKKECDFLFMIPHAGVEYMEIPLPEWRDRYKELLEWGADAIIATHPHVPQGWEVINGKPIFYSLGNLFFDLHKDEKRKPKYWDNGLIVILELQKGKISYQVVPIYKENNTLQIDSTQATQTHLDEIVQILSDDEKYMEKVNEDVLLFWKSHEAILLRGFNAQKISFHWKNLAKIFYSLLFLKPKIKLSLNYMRSESSRYIMTRALKIKTKSKL